MSWGFGSWFKLVFGIWTAVFLFVIIPLTMLYSWKVGTLPVAEGVLSNHHIVKEKRKQAYDEVVKATLEFERPSAKGPVQCKHDEVRIGFAVKPESYVRRVEVAVRTDSCHGYFLLPLNTPSVPEWVLVFLMVGGSLFIVVVVSYYGDRWEAARMRRVEGKS